MPSFFFALLYLRVTLLKGYVILVGKGRVLLVYSLFGV
jgi:hypothetical protein